MPSIRDFSGGVINQELATKDNGGGFVIDCKNVVSSCNGELRKRTGTRFLVKLDGDSRIIPFRLPVGNDTILVFSNEKVVGYSYVDEKNVEPLVEYTGEAPTFPTSSEWVSNTVSNDYGDWTLFSSSTADSVYYALRNSNPYNEPPREITYNGKGFGQNFNWNDWDTTSQKIYVQFYCSSPQILKNITLRNGYKGIQPTAFSGWTNRNTTTHDLNVILASAKVLAYNPVLQYSDDGVVWYNVESSIENTRGLYCSPYVNNTYFTRLTSDDILTQTNHLYPHYYWRVVYDNQNLNSSISVSGYTRGVGISNVNFYATSGAQTFEGATPFTTDNLQNLKYTQTDNYLIVCDGVNIPQKYTFAGNTMSISDYTLTGSPSTGIYTEGNYPSCCCFFQNRLWFGGFPNNKTTVIGSEFGDYDNFTIPATVLSTSPIEVKSVEIKSIVENLYGGNLALYGLSADGISMIDAQGSIVATNNIEFKLRNREPVNSMTPTEKDDIMIYLGLNKKNIFITDYDYIVQRFKAHDISSNYNNYFESGISELHYIPQKSRYIYGLNSDGSFFALLFEIDKEKNALFPFNTNGRVLDISKIKYNNNIRLVMVVERNGRFFIEEKNTVQYNELFDLTTPEQQKIMSSNVFVSKENYVDCSTFYLLDGEKTTLLDVPYQVGNKVQCITEAGYCGELLVEDGDPVLKYKWHASIVPPEGFPQDVYVSTEYDTTQLSVGDIVYSKQTIDGVDYFSIVGRIGGFYEGREFYIQSEFENHTLYSASIVSESAIIRGSTKVELPSAYYQVILGYSYESYAVIKFTVPYTSQKYLTEIATNFINTGYLEIGSSLDNLEPVVGNLVDNVYLDDRPILMNGIYKKTITKETEFSPYLIVSSDKGLPFTITGIDYKIDYSNYQGGV